MKQPSNISILILLFFLSISQNSFSQQNENQLFITNSANRSKLILADTDYFIKIKTTNGEKIRGKFSVYNDDRLISNENDTIYFSDIKWIRARKLLSERQKRTAKYALFLGTYISFKSTGGILYMVVFGYSPALILIPLATISASIIGLKTLTGKKYKMKKWDLYSRSKYDSIKTNTKQTQNSGISFR